MYFNYFLYKCLVWPNDSIESQFYFPLKILLNASTKRKLNVLHLNIGIQRNIYFKKCTLISVF